MGSINPTSGVSDAASIMNTPLSIAPTNNAAQDRIGEERCHWLAVREPHTLKGSGLDLDGRPRQAGDR
jgi:hypothetical protein